MKVLFLEASSGHVVGGSLTGMVHLISGLDRSRYEPVVVLYEDKEVVEELRQLGVRVIVFNKRRLPRDHGLHTNPSYRRVKSVSAVASVLQFVRRAGDFAFETLPTALRLSRVLSAEKPDLVHVCNGYRANLDAIVAARLCRIPCVVHSKGFDKHSFVERGLAGGVAASICMTEAIKSHCVSQGIRPPAYHVIYDGLDLERFKPEKPFGEIRHEFGIEEDGRLVVVVGNLQEWKGQIVVLEALLLLKERIPALTVALVGGVHRSGHDYAERCRRFVEEQGLASRVLFTGARGDVPDVMAAADVVVHSSVRGEPFGRVIIEAMAVGTPVVATRAGGVPEFVHQDKDGLLVEPGDPAALADALVSILENGEVAQALALGGRANAELFSLQRHVDSICAVYDGVIERYHGSPGSGVRA